MSSVQRDLFQPPPGSLQCVALIPLTCLFTMGFSTAGHQPSEAGASLPARSSPWVNACTSQLLNYLVRARWPHEWMNDLTIKDSMSREGCWSFSNLTPMCADAGRQLGGDLAGLAHLPRWPLSAAFCSDDTWDLFLILKDVYCSIVSGSKKLGTKGMNGYCYIRSTEYYTAGK